ncbi:MAG: glutathione S-transferase family protein [Alcaligenaceae bacterium]|nr:glutathione S-transferase family protein [Alcaligenaceae bacterium]
MEKSITLYHSVSARSFRPLWALEELGLDYELVMMEFPPRVHRRDFLDTNPLGTIPAMMTEHGLMTESAAMCQYIVSRKPGTSLAIAEHEKDFGSYLNFIHYGEATLTFPQTLVLRYQHFEPPERQHPGIVADYTQWFISRSRLLDQVLQKSDYLCGERFTIADISVAYALMLADYIELLNQCSESIQDYWHRLQQRPAFLKTLEIEQQAAKSQGVSILPTPKLRPFAKQSFTS